jgi:hypothetical protein
MNNIGKSCLKLLLAYAVAAAIVGVIVYHRVPVFPAAFWGGVIAGFFLWLTLAYLISIPGGFLDWWNLRPGAKPRDGKRAAIAGPIRALGASAHSPFTKTACVAYHYKITSWAGESPSTAYEGFMLVPSYIATEDGQVKIQAWPELDVKWEPVRGAELKENVRAYLDATSFTNTLAGGFRGMLEEMRKHLADDDGAIRYDYRIAAVADDLDKCKIEERVIRAGESVCAVGIYSEERKALVPDRKAPMYGITIRHGDAGTAQRRALRKAIGSAVGVVVCSAILAVAAAIFLVNFPMDASEQKNPARRFLWEEVKLERWLDANVRGRLVAADALGSRGMYFLELCDHCATGRLEANGRIVELRHAEGWESETQRVMHLSAAKGDRDGVTIDYDRKGRKLQVSVIMNGRAFPVPDQWLQPNDFQTSLDSNQTMNGRLTVMAPNDEVRVRTSWRVPLEGR